MNFRGKNIDLVGKQNLWFGISLAVILIGLFSWAFFGLNLGIDFRGGGQVQYRLAPAQKPAPNQEAALLSQVNAALRQGGLERTRTQIIGGDTLSIATDAPSEDALRTQENVVEKVLGDKYLLTERAPNGQQVIAKPLSRQLVGPIIGDELKRNAINGVILGVALIALWIYLRYNFAGDGLRYAVAGIAALVHDVLVLIGLFALIGHFDPRVEMDGSFIAALLTVVGYSINDSVVIFDRIRENLRLRRREPFNTVVNDSLLETMSRSINTGLTVLIMLLFLLFFGGQSIYNFVLAMLVGITSGLYSSIFNASMVLTAWHAHDEKKANAARGTSAAPARVSATTNVVNVAPAPRPVLSSGSATIENSVSNGTSELPEPRPSDAASRPEAPRKARAKRRF